MFLGPFDLQADRYPSAPKLQYPHFGVIVLLFDPANVEPRASEVFGELAMEEQPANAALRQESLERVLARRRLRAAWPTVIAHQRLHVDSGLASVRVVPGVVRMLSDLRLVGRL